MIPLRGVERAEDTNRGLLLHCDRHIGCRISLLAPDLVRVIFLREGAPRLDRTWTVLAHGTTDVPWEGRDRLDEASWPVPEFGLQRTAEHITLETAALSLEVALHPLRLTWRLPDGRIFAADRANHPYAFGRTGALLHAQTRHESDRYYGLGDKTGSLNLHGRRLRIAMLDSLGFDPRSGDPLYKHWPFLLVRDGATGAGYGLYYDNGARAEFDLGCERDNYYGAYRTYEARDGDLDFYLILGPRLAEVTPNFLALTGRPAMPPRWTLGFAQTAMALADAPDAQAQIEAFIDRCAAEDTPVSAFHFGSGYTMREGRRYVFTWNRDKFPEPQRLTQRFHDANIKVVANLKPCLLQGHPAFAQVAAAGGFVRTTEGAPSIAQFWDGEGAHIDFTSPAGIGWWQDGLSSQVLAQGIDVGWNDNNEYNLPDDSCCDGFGRPVPLELIRGVQALLMTRATLERQQATTQDQRSFTVTRAGCTGVQRYAQSWSGDNTTSWENLRWNLRTGLQVSLSGLLNTGHDVGGFSGRVPEPELLVRWTQAGLLHPRFIMNSWKPGGVYTSPWLHPEVLPMIRSAIHLRLRLIPMLYSLMHRAASNGEPVIRPTFLNFGEDSRAWDDCDELMLGPFLLGAPVVAPGERARRLYLPQGPECWFDFWSEERLSSGAEAVLAAPLDRLPLAVPAGAIIAMTESAAGFAKRHDEPSRCIRVFPGERLGTGQFVLIEDDGTTANGPTTEVRLELSWTPREVQIRTAASGGYSLPYQRIVIELPEAERRKIVLRSADAAPPLIRARA
jgi:alpha-glucosidase